ncbi:MAG: GNAT family N-acetyltransferase [Syntrophobacteraceae bacterium]|nr:GNAT family N-acetyltransferase [Syntrophobacteraceae bacterium]
MENFIYTIRTMTRLEIDMAVEWAAAEGWNPGLYDSDCFYGADPNGFLIGLLGEQPVATISAVKYGDSFGFLGFYIVKPQYRGKGFGLKIWNAGLEYLAERTIGLDGVVAQQDNYRKSGFKLAYGNIRHQGTARRFPVDPGIVELHTIAFEEVCAYDRAFFPDRRREFLRCWLDQPQSRALGLIRNGKLAGYGVVRMCRSGYKTGPLFADSPELAESLFRALQAHLPEEAPIYLDTPAENPAALDLANRHNMSAVFETARMYRGKSPDVDMERLFGVTSFELG